MLWSHAGEYGGQGNGAARAPLPVSAGRRDRHEAMDGWWSEIDQEICDGVARHGSVAPVDLARQLGLSESALASLLSLLVPQGRLRIIRVELPPSAPTPA